MIIVIMGDPQTGQVNMASEGCDLLTVRKVLKDMVTHLDTQLNNGAPPPTESGLILPARTMPPPPLLPPPSVL